ncbi:MAG: tetratricopeptide repeat protein, partial [Candidatus Brocadiales bacterium]
EEKEEYEGAETIIAGVETIEKSVETAQPADAAQIRGEEVVAFLRPVEAGGVYLPEIPSPEEWVPAATVKEEELDTGVAEVVPSPVSAEDGEEVSHYTTGQEFHQRGMYEEAIRELKLALAETPNSADVHFDLGRAYHKTNDKKKAFAAYRKTLDIDPDNKRARFLLDILTGVKRKGMKHTAPSSVQLTPTDVGVASSPVVKEEELKVSVVEEKGPHHKMGREFYQNDMYKEAIRELKFALAENPDSADVHFDLGRAYHKTNDKKEAFVAYRKTLNIDPDHKKARFLLDTITGTKRKGGEHQTPSSVRSTPRDVASSPVVREQEVEISLEVEEGASHRLQGRKYHKKGMYKEAIRELKLALAKDPNSADVHFDLGRAYHKANDKKKAFAAYRKTLDIDPDNKRARFLLDTITGIKGTAKKYSPTASLPDELGPQVSVVALSSQPEEGEEIFVSMEEVEVPGGAIEFAQRTGGMKSGRHPGLEEGISHRALGQEYLESGMYAEAIQEFKLALADSPNDAEIYYDLGRAYQKANNGREAFAAYRRALRIDPDHKKARFLLKTLTGGKGG